MILSDARAVKLTFTADTLGSGATDVIHVFALTVTDNLGEAHTVEVMVTVTSSALPVAHASEDWTVVSGVEVILDGSGASATSGRHIVSHAWARKSGRSAGSEYYRGE